MRVLISRTIGVLPLRRDQFFAICRRFIRYVQPPIVLVVLIGMLKPWNHSRGWISLCSRAPRAAFFPRR